MFTLIFTGISILGNLNSKFVFSSFIVVITDDLVSTFGLISCFVLLNLNLGSSTDFTKLVVVVVSFFVLGFVMISLLCLDGWLFVVYVVFILDYIYFLLF